MKIAYLGPERTNSEKAAFNLGSRLASSCELVPCVAIQGVAQALGKNGVSFGVMPYYNYLEGLVQQTLDIIYDHNFFIHDVCRMPITHCLGAYPGSKENDQIYSISVALGQCTDYLSSHYPSARQVTVSSTAEGARIVAEKKSGLAVSNREALEYYGLDILADDIGNRRHGKANFTDFYLVSTEQAADYDPDEEYFTMVAVTPHIDRSGLLAQILQHVAFFEINNAKIHSRPAIDFVAMDLDPQMFYIEMMAHQSSPDFCKCIETLTYAMTPKGKDVEVVKILGSYRRPRIS
jgi:prephenate dehydratase